MSQAKKQTKRPVGRPRADGRSHLTRQDVFRASAKLMSVFGFTGTSVRMIADELDCTTASIFNLFPTKKDLFDELISNTSAPAFEFQDRLRALRLAPSEALFKSLFEETLILNEAPVAFIAIYALPELRHPDFGHARKQRKKLVSHYENIIRAGIGDGEFTECDPHWMAEQMIQLVETCIMAGDQFSIASRKQRALETARFGLRGLLNDPDKLDQIEQKCAQIDITYNAPEVRGA